MKTITLCFLIVMFSNVLLSQSIKFPVDSVTKEICYTEVVTVDGMSKDQLYINCKNWLVQNFNSAKAVTDIDDKESGILSGAAGIAVYSPFIGSAPLGYVRFTFRIDIKEGRYRYKFNNFIHDPKPSNAKTSGNLLDEKPLGGALSMGQKNWDGIKTQTHEVITNSIKSLKKCMSVTSDDNW